MPQNLGQRFIERLVNVKWHCLAALLVLGDWAFGCQMTLNWGQTFLGLPILCHVCCPNATLSCVEFGVKRGYCCQCFFLFVCFCVCGKTEPPFKLRQEGKSCWCLDRSILGPMGRKPPASTSLIFIGKIISMMLASVFSQGIKVLHLFSWITGRFSLSH